MNEKLRNSGIHTIWDKQVRENSHNVVYRRNLQTDSLDFMSQVVEKVAGFSAPEVIAMAVSVSILISFILMTFPSSLWDLPMHLISDSELWSTSSNIRRENTAGSPITLWLSRTRTAGLCLVKASCAMLPRSKSRIRE
jgi:hypothetical protein